MKLLNQIPTKYFVAIDIETVRYTENYEDLSEEWQSAWEYKNKQSGEIPDQEELADLWKKKASLYAEFSKICAVSLVFLDKTESTLACKEFYGDDEIIILTELGVFLDKIAKGDKNFRLIGHAAKFFDYPFLAKRYIINGEDIPLILDTAHLKPWENQNLCTNMDIWKMGGTGSGSSLQALCTALQIPVSKVDLVGDEVGQAYFNGEFERIGKYCSYDTIATFNIVRKIKKEPIFEFDKVRFLDVKEEVIEEKSFLEKLYNLDDFTLELQEELTSILDKKKLTKKDKENLFIILKGVYSRTDFVNNDQDNKAMKESKEEEIKEFIENL